MIEYDSYKIGDLLKDKWGCVYVIESGWEEGVFLGKKTKYLSVDVVDWCADNKKIPKQYMGKTGLIVFEDKIVKGIVWKIPNPSEIFDQLENLPILIK